MQAEHRLSRHWQGEETKMSHEQVPLPQCGEADLSDTSAALEDSLVCQNHSCPVDYCYNQGHCYISQALDCQPMCTCPPAFIDTQCLLAGNSFTPTVHGGTTRCPAVPTPYSLGSGETGVQGQLLRVIDQNSDFSLHVVSYRLWEQVRPAVMS